jgi:hypothetical protein
MKRFTLIALLSAVCLWTGIRDASAQHSVGINAGYNLDAKEFFLGGQARFAPASLPVILNPSIETYFVDFTWLQIDINALYPFGSRNTTFTPYAGAGLGINYVKPEGGDGDTDAGLNLLFGAEWGMSRLRPFTEARIVVDGEVGVGLRGGLLIGL